MVVLFCNALMALAFASVRPHSDVAAEVDALFVGPAYYVKNGEIFCFMEIRPRGLRLVRLPLKPKHNADMTSTEFFLSSNGAVFDNPNPVFHVAHGCIWATEHPDGCWIRIPLEEIDAFDLDNPRAREALREKYAESTLAHSWIVTPTPENLERITERQEQERQKLLGMRPLILMPFYTFDFVPDSPTSGKTFTLKADGRMRVWECKATWHKQDRQWDTEFGKAEIESFRCPFQERFQTFIRGDDYYFLTRSGKLYISRKPEKGERKMELLWDNAKKPITHVITDVDQDKIFVFCKNKEAKINAKDFYFELAEKPDPQEFAISDLKEIKADEPIKTLWQYATLLAERRKGGK